MTSIRTKIGTRTLKTAIGATLAILLAQQLGLKYSASAGVITILSIQSTKKESIIVAIRRLMASLIALTIGSIIFSIIGYNPIGFGIYLIIFIPLIVKFNVVEGIVMASVLVTHLLGERAVTIELLVNEILLIVVGAGIALILNLYMPSIEGELAKDRELIEELMETLFRKMAGALKQCAVSIEEEQLFNQLNQVIIRARANSYKYSNNYLWAKLSPYERYFEMRGAQLRTMNDMREHFKRFFMTFEETAIVADFAEQVASSIRGEILAKELLDQLHALREKFKQSHLPTTREEFENRAMLYQYLNDIERFLMIKQEFRESLSEDELALYEKGYTKS